MLPGLDRDTMLAWMRGVDEGPFSVLAAGERIAWPSQEMMATLAAAAVTTERVGLMASVSVAPMHPAALVAKQAATIDVLSGGRLTLGLGVGGRDEDYRALGAEFDGRHQRLAEHVAEMRRIWSGEPPAEGIHPVGPVPVQKGGPRLLSASMGPKSMARSAHWADGVAGWDIGPDPVSVATSMKAFEAAWRGAERPGRPFLQTSFWYGLGPSAPERVPEYAFRYLEIFGEATAKTLSSMAHATSEAALRDLLPRLADAGCDEIILVATTFDLDELRRTTDLVASLDL